MWRRSSSRRHKTLPLSIDVVMTDTISVIRLGVVDYEEALRLQERLAAARAQEVIGDALLLLEHPPVITIGRGGGEEDLLVSREFLLQQGIRTISTDRGGRATYHGPGQLVVYPILRLPDGDLYRYVWRLEEVAIRVLRPFGLRAERLEGHPGVWVNGRKIAAIGLSVQNGVTRHGLALNIAPRMAHFNLFIPCGLRDRGVTSMERELGYVPDPQEVTDQFVRMFAEVFGYQVREESPEWLREYLDERALQPVWLWRSLSAERQDAVRQMEDLLGGLALHTVCQEAQCPNLPECFGQGTATFLILGDICTRNCRFCAVKKGRPLPPDPEEPERVAEAAFRLRLRYVVVTSVTRDDLPDGGAGHFAATIRAIRRRLPGAGVEVLIPDFRGSLAAMETVLDAGPDVVNHNVETVPRLYPLIRPQADYQRSIGILSWVKVRAPRIPTKSGLMLGLGERRAEVLGVFYDLREAGCDVLTLGQYLQPTERQHPVVRYIPPEEFAEYREKAESLGFRKVVAGPLVRSSYQAGQLPCPS
ncbi:MAG: lipoyl synthase [Anaerolineae bacterium]|nr:lipoyl synthase [Anaerolineae bacterium]